MFVYLFRQKGTGQLALTTDVTGRNIPSLMPSTHWIFVESLDVNKGTPLLDIADFEDVLRQLQVSGYHIFAADR